MRDAKNNAKLTGDTHPPEVEDDAGHDDGASAADAAGSNDGKGKSGKPERDLRETLADEGRPGKGVNQAGFLKDKDGATGAGKP